MVKLPNQGDLCRHQFHAADHPQRAYTAMLLELGSKLTQQKPIYLSIMVGALSPALLNLNAAEPVYIMRWHLHPCLLLELMGFCANFVLMSHFGRKTSCSDSSQAPKPCRGCAILSVCKL